MSAWNLGGIISCVTCGVISKVAALSCTLTDDVLVLLDHCLQYCVIWTSSQLDFISDHCTQIDRVAVCNVQGLMKLTKLLRRWRTLSAGSTASMWLLTFAVQSRDAPIIGRQSESADYYASIGRLLFTMYYDGIGYGNYIFFNLNWRHKLVIDANLANMLIALCIMH